MKAPGFGNNFRNKHRNMATANGGIAFQDEVDTEIIERRESALYRETGLLYCKMDVDACNVKDGLLD